MKDKYDVVIVGSGVSGLYAALQFDDGVGIDFDAALPVAFLVLVGVVLEVTLDAEEVALDNALLLGPLATGTDEDVEEIGFFGLGAVLLGVGAMVRNLEAHLAFGVIGWFLVDGGYVADDFNIVVVVLFLCHNT